MPDAPLRLGLLQCGHIHPDLVATHGDYPELFGQLLAPHGVELRTYVAEDGVLPESNDECDGWLVSGSASSAYDDLPWIPPLEDLLRSFVADQAPLVAICFGHQVLAQALGGRVEKSPGGWGVGVQAYDRVDSPGGVMRLLASHQDQVIELPSSATLVATSDYCPVAAFTVGPAALAIQPHPEFTPGVSRGLIELRRDAIGTERSDAALATLDGANDSRSVGGWMVDFLRAAQPAGR